MSSIIPDMFLARQLFEDKRLHDPASAVWQAMEKYPFLERYPPGSSIAVAVGSRGIANLPLIVRTVIDFWKSRGCHPFIFPAMGSHGGATAAGQAGKLAGLGITESAMGCKIISSMELVETGTTPEGIPTFIDKNAFMSDGIFLINRINRHTDFTANIESGIIKMIAIGLGKDTGATLCHKYAYGGDSLGSIIRSVARQLTNTGKIMGGLAILEDAYNHTAYVEAIATPYLETREIALLKQVKASKPALPVPDLKKGVDILAVTAISKGYSGPGVDPMVVNRDFLTGQKNKRQGVPWVGLIVLLDLGDDSMGNAMGIGMANVLHQRVIDKMSVRDTIKNAETAQAPGAASVSLFTYPTDRLCFEQAIAKFTYCSNIADARIAWIPNSKELEYIAFSANMMDEIAGAPKVEIVGPARPLIFDRHGQLLWRSPLSLR